MTTHMNIDSPLYAHRVAGGLYDNIVGQLLDLPKGVSLGDATYNENFVRETNVHTGNFAYKCSDTGTEYETVLVGEIKPRASGTKFSAIGNHYLGTAPNPNAIEDKTRVKGVFTLGKPTNATEMMTIAYDNQMVTLNDIIESDIQELKRKKNNINIKEWTSHAGADTTTAPEHIVIHTGQLYAVPKAIQQAVQGKRAKITKRSFTKADNPTDTTPEDESTSQATTSTILPTITTNDFYNPKILPDYHGEIFQHENAQLRQLDFRDLNNELITPSDWYSQLRRGTLVMVRATLHAYNWEGRRVYQLNAQTIRVLDESCLEMEPVMKNKSDDEDTGALGTSAAASAMSSIQLGKRTRDESD